MLSSLHPYGSCSAFKEVLWLILFILYLRNLLILSKLQWKLLSSAVCTCRIHAIPSKNACCSIPIFFLPLLPPFTLCFVSCLLISSLPCFSITVDHRHHILLLIVPMKSEGNSLDFAQEPGTVFGLFSCSLAGGGQREMCKLVALAGWSLLGFLLSWSVLIISKVCTVKNFNSARQNKAVLA